MTLSCVLRPISGSHGRAIGCGFLAQSYRDARRRPIGCLDDWNCTIYMPLPSPLHSREDRNGNSRAIIGNAARLRLMDALYAGMMGPMDDDALCMDWYLGLP
jgi:hypothetical protein